MNINLLRPNDLLRDTEAADADKAFYRFGGFHRRAGENGYEATHVASGDAAVLNESELEGTRFEIVPRRPYVEIVLEPLLGERVKCVMQWGTVSGTLTEIRYVTVEIEGNDTRFPSEFIVSGDACNIRELKSIATV